MAIRFWPGLSHQQQNIFTAETLAFSLAGLLIWLLALSRLRWAVRLIVLGVLIGASFAGRTFFTIRGVSGRLVPIVDWKGRKPAWTANKSVSGFPRPTGSPGRC